jgi:hypothetical protein
MRECRPVTFEETLARYEEKFGEWPPIAVWANGRERLQELCEKAIRDGKALTIEDLLKAQYDKDVLY